MGFAVVVCSRSLPGSRSPPGSGTLSLVLDLSLSSLSRLSSSDLESSEPSPDKHNPESCLCISTEASSPRVRVSRDSGDQSQAVVDHLLPASPLFVTVTTNVFHR